MTYQLKYRNLTKAELSELEKEFVRFLATHKITAQDWIRFKEQDEDRVGELIAQFSDLVFEQVLSKVDYLIWKTPNELRVYHLTPAKIYLIGLINRSENNRTSTLDFTKNETAAEMMQHLRDSNAKVQLFTAERAYQVDRKMDAFQLMEQGALISRDGDLYQLLKDLRSGQLN